MHSSEQKESNNCVRQVCHVSLAFQYAHEWDNERSENENGGEISRRGRGWSWTELLYADKLINCKSDDLRVMIGSFVRVSKRKGLKVNADKYK